MLTGHNFGSMEANDEARRPPINHDSSLAVQKHALPFIYDDSVRIFFWLVVNIDN